VPFKESYGFQRVGREQLNAVVRGTDRDPSSIGTESRRPKLMHPRGLIEFSGMNFSLRVTIPDHQDAVHRNTIGHNVKPRRDQIFSVRIKRQSVFRTIVSGSQNLGGLSRRRDRLCSSY